MLDAERTRAATQLYERYAQGAISADEYSKRYNLIQASSNSWEIQRAFAGLPGAAPAQASAPQQQVGAPPSAPPPGFAPQPFAQAYGAPISGTPPVPLGYTPGSVPPAPYTFGPPGFAVTAPYGAYAPPAARPVAIWVPILLIISGAGALLLIALFVATSVSYIGTPEDVANEHLGAWLFSVPLALCAIVSFVAAFAQFLGKGWGKWMGIVAGAFICVGVLGIPLGVPIIIGSVKSQ